jgi:hypothetical protein
MERALMDLVGDLSTYSPRSKVVILEGGGDAEFDVALVQRLFPEFAERVNLVSGGSKRRVVEMHDLLDAASSEGKLSARFFSIVDRDFDGPDSAKTENRFEWDTYHVENYLLEPRFIRDVMVSLHTKGKAPSEMEVEQQLKDCAADTVNALVRIKMEKFVNGALVNCIKTTFDPKLGMAMGFRSAAERSKSALDQTLEEKLPLKVLSDLEQQTREALILALDDNDRWKAEFRGRDILQRFSNRLGISYERFRNLIVSRMAEVNYQPNGMKKIISEIMSDGGRGLEP